MWYNVLLGFVFAIGESFGFLAEYLIVGGLFQSLLAQTFSFYTPFGTNEIVKKFKIKKVSM
jgi:hypothetical protein